MTRRRFDLWNALGWAMVAVAVVLAAAGYVALLVHQPVATGFVTSYGLVAVVTWWLTGRNLRAELEAVRQRLATYNASETHEALAEARSGEFEVEPFMADSGYRPPRHKENEDYPDWWLNDEPSPYDVEHDIVLSVPERPALTLDGTVHVVERDCPEAGGCRRPDQCETACHWRALGALNRPYVDDDSSDSLPRSLPGNGGNQ